MAKLTIDGIKGLMDGSHTCEVNHVICCITVIPLEKEKCRQSLFKAFFGSSYISDESPIVIQSTE